MPIWATLMRSLAPRMREAARALPASPQKRRRVRCGAIAVDCIAMKCPAGPRCYSESYMYLKILAHPVFVNLDFHMPIIVDLSHPLIMLTGENGSGKSTLLHAIYYAMRGEQVENYIYKLDLGDFKPSEVYLFDAEAHNPRTNLDFFKKDPQMVEFLQMASHGQVMLSMFRENFPNLENGTVLLLDEPEMALSV